MNAPTRRFSVGQHVRRYASERVDRVTLFVRMPMHWWTWHTRVFVCMSIAIAVYLVVALTSLGDTTRSTAPWWGPYPSKKAVRASGRAQTQSDRTYRERTVQSVPEAWRGAGFYTHRDEPMLADLADMAMRAGLEIDRLERRDDAKRQGDALPMTAFVAHGTYAAVLKWVSRVQAARSGMVVERLRIARPPTAADAHAARSPTAADAHAAKTRLNVEAEITRTVSAARAMTQTRDDVLPHDSDESLSPMLRATVSPFDINRLFPRRVAGRIRGSVREVVLVVGPAAAEHALEGSMVGMGAVDASAVSADAAESIADNANVADANVTDVNVADVNAAKASDAEISVVQTRSDNVATSEAPEISPSTCEVLVSETCAKHVPIRAGPDLVDEVRPS